MKSWKDDPRSATNPLFNDNKLKLGLFALNSGSQVMTLAPERYITDWDRADQTAAMMDRLGVEAMVSAMGWMGVPEDEPFTWISALAARHAHIALIATFHMPLMHPSFVARASVTVDRVSAGRFGLNVVAGFNPDTFAAFGCRGVPADERYDHAAEYMELLKKLWTSEEHFAFEGRYFNLPKVRCNPLPVQKLPPVMNAGISGRGQDFACKYADMVFTLLEADMDDARAQIAHYKRRAREQFGREIQVWTQGYIVIRETRREAEDFLNYYAGEMADHQRIEAWLKALKMTADPHEDPARRARLYAGWAAGAGTRMVGTAQEVAEQLGALSDIGLDGMIWNTIEPETLLDHAGRALLPALEASGHRRARRQAS